MQSSTFNIEMYCTIVSVVKYREIFRYIIITTSTVGCPVFHYVLSESVVSNNCCTEIQLIVLEGDIT